MEKQKTETNEGVPVGEVLDRPEMGGTPDHNWMRNVDQQDLLPPPVKASAKELKKAMKQKRLESPVLLVGWDPSTGLGNVYFKTPERGLVVFRNKAKKPLLVVPLRDDFAAKTPYGQMFWFNIKTGQLIQPDHDGGIKGIDGRFFADAWDDSRIQKIVKQKAPGMLEMLQPYMPLMMIASIILLVIIAFRVLAGG